MINKNKYYKFISLVLIMFLAVGYAVVNSVNLTVTGTAGAGTQTLDVYYNGETSVSDSSKVIATATNGSTSATITVSNLTLNESVTATYTIKNNEIDVDANYYVSNITLSNSDYFSITTDSSETKSIAAGGKNTITVTVTMIKTPITSTNSTSSITIDLSAEPTTTPNIISFTIHGQSYQAIEGMTWQSWVDSEYNDGDYYIIGSRIYQGQISYYIYGVQPEDIIIDGVDYSMASNEPQ